MNEQSQDKKVAIDKVRNIQIQWRNKTVYNHEGYHLHTVSFVNDTVCPLQTGKIVHFTQKDNGMLFGHLSWINYTLSAFSKQ